jgi:hypothetical protein
MERRKYRFFYSSRGGQNVTLVEIWCESRVIKSIEQFGFFVYVLGYGIIAFLPSGNTYTFSPDSRG